MSEPEAIIGTLVVSAEAPGYDLVSLVFTDRQLLKIPVSKMGALVGAGSLLAGWLAGAANPFAFSGFGGLIGLRQWGNVKKQMAGMPVVGMDRTPATPELIAAATFRLPYDKVKEVKISKVWMSSDQVLSVGAGFLSSMKVVFDGRGLEEVKTLVASTPLASRLKR